MIRFAFIQARLAGLVAAIGLAAVAIALALTGPHLASVNDAFQRACRTAGDCATATNPVLEVDPFLQSALPFLVTVAPALIGLFFGAPLVAREFETGTFRLAWTQSVTRRRWLVVKLALVGLVSMAVGGALTWMVDWWRSPLDAVNENRFDPANFGIHGVAPVGYAGFAFVLGVTAGVLLRRTIPAMVVTLVGFVGVRLAVEYRLRPYLAAPLHKAISLLSSGRFGSLSVDASTGTFTLTPPPETIPNGWVLSTADITNSGHVLTTQDFLRACPAYGQFRGAPPPPSVMESAHAACISKLSETFYTVVTYQPGSRFWPFQWAEMGIFVAAALALCGLTYWWLQRRWA